MRTDFKVTTDIYVDGRPCYAWHADRVSAENHARELRRQGATVEIQEF